jgi:hypothetical protein
MAVRQIEKTRDPSNFEEAQRDFEALAPDAVAILHVSHFDGSPSTRIPPQQLSN